MIARYVASLTLRLSVICLLLSLGSGVGARADEVPVTAGEAEIVVARSPAEGCYLLIWLPSMYDEEDLEQDFVAGLAAAGLEIWWVDLVNARFLPRSYRSYDEVPPEDVVAVIEAAVRISHKPIALMASGRGALVGLSGIVHWKERHPRAGRVLGMLAMHPNYYAYTPAPGEMPVFHHALDDVPVSVQLLEPEYSPRYLWLDRSVEHLREAGADVSVRFLRQVRAGFHYRPDPSPKELETRAAFPAILRQALDAMARQN